MNRTVEVHVTETDISAGIVSDCEKCPVARAISRALELEIMVDTDSFYSEWDDVTLDGLASIPLPAEAQAFIAIFDDGGYVLPFTFPITVDA